MLSFTTWSCRSLGVPLAAAALLVLSGHVTAQELRTAAAARQLTSTLDRLKLDAVAAPDPSAPDRFLAALYFPGAQLLVVSAQYSAPSLLKAKLEKRDYRDVYIDLNAASVPGSKIFVMDGGADGLSPRPDDSHGTDSWEQEGKTVTFDGDWRGAKLSEQEYMKIFTSADEQYARMLTALAEYAAGSGS